MTDDELKVAWVVELLSGLTTAERRLAEAIMLGRSDAPQTITERVLLHRIRAKAYLLSPPPSVGL